MRTFGLTTSVMLLICLVGWVGVADDNIEPKGFTIRVNWTEEGKDPADAAKRLSSPMVMTLADLPVCVHVGNEHDFHGRTLPHGMKFNVTLRYLDEKHVMLDGDLEISDLSETNDDFVYRTCNSLHFHHRVELGKSHDIKVKGAGGTPQVVSIFADSCDGQDSE